MTNFAFIMDLLKISSKKFLEIGFDKSLVSRWRRGKLRLMPGRHIVKSISELFWLVDLNNPKPVLREILNIWYPAQPCDTKEEQHRLLEKFLTEKEQFDKEYEEQREKRLGKLTDSKEDRFIPSKGIDPAKFRILDFLDLTAQIKEPLAIETVYPQGRGTVSFDIGFNSKVFRKLENNFSKGHKMNSFLRSDDAVSKFAYSYNNIIYYFLNGYMTNEYFDDFRADTKEIFLAAAGDLAALELIEEESDRIESTVSAIYTDKEHIDDIKKRIHQYAACSKVRDYSGFFKNSGKYLKYVHISPDSPCYMFIRLPHFGILDEKNFSKSFSLSNYEKEFLDEEIKPFMFSPSFYWEYASVRHIFCENDIECELNKKRHQSEELSALLNRRVWMTTQSLINNLVEIKKLLTTHKNYEVCFLNDTFFKELKIQLAVWGYGASVSWIDSTRSAASRGYMNQRIIQGFCHASWSKIPENLKSRELAFKKIERWLKTAQKLGYDTETGYH